MRSSVAQEKGIDMVAYKFTIPSEICGKVESYIRNKFRDDKHVFIQAQFDDEILLVADSRDLCRGTRSEVAVICEYENVEYKCDTLKDD